MRSEPAAIIKCLLHFKTTSTTLLHQQMELDKEGAGILVGVGCGYPNMNLILWWGFEVRVIKVGVYIGRCKNTEKDAKIKHC